MTNVCVCLGCKGAEQQEAESALALRSVTVCTSYRLIHTDSGICSRYSLNLNPVMECSGGIIHHGCCRNSYQGEFYLMEAFLMHFNSHLKVH